MRRRWTVGGVVFSALIAILIVVALGAVSARPHNTALGSAASAPSWTCGAWGAVTSASVPNQLNFLSGVAALPDGDAWASGYSVMMSTNHLQTLIERSSGGAWSIVASPNSGTSSNALYGIAAVSTSDVWAVGGFIGTTATQTLVERWNGTSWSVVASPNAGTGNNVLNGVAAVASNNVWAVGYSGGSSGLGGEPGQALIEHYDGTSWAIVPNPGSAFTRSTLQAVAASSASDVWAVGDSEGPTGMMSTLIEHYNGTSWSLVLAPNPSPQSNSLFGVAVDSASDAWAVGFYESPTPIMHTLAEHWNGRYWSVAATPDGGANGNALYAVTATSASDVWAVGQFFHSGGVTDGLTEHWNGATWSLVSSPDPGDISSIVKGVAAVSTNSVWAAGDQQSQSKPGQQTLVQHFTRHPSSSPCGPQG